MFLKAYNEALTEALCFQTWRRLFPFLPEDLAVTVSHSDHHPVQLGDDNSFSVVIALWDTQVAVWAMWKKLLLTAGG